MKAVARSHWLVKIEQTRAPPLPAPLAHRTRPHGRVAWEAELLSNSLTQPWVA